MLRFLKILARNLSLGPSTDPFPFKEAHTPERYRGRVIVDPDRCMGCHVCQHVCAGKAIRIEDNADKTGYQFTIWHNTCALCGMCQHFCPTQAIKQTNDWHNAHTQQDKYAWSDHFEIPYLSCLGCGAPIRVLPPDLAARVYAHSPENMQKIMQLCPSCRQVAAARRQERLMPPKVETPDEDAAEPTEEKLAPIEKKAAPAEAKAPEAEKKETPAEVKAPEVEKKAAPVTNKAAAPAKKAAEAKPQVNAKKSSVTGKNTPAGKE